MFIFPNAKINIGLRIINRRIDGYHTLETILFPIKIKDIVEVIETDKLTFSSSGTPIPGNSIDNLCLKAYHIIHRDMNIPPVHIHLHKHIPIGAGLGGGSADAAFLIKLLDKKFALGLSLEKMEFYAKQLGADCAFFIHNQPVLATERGDQFHPITLALKDYYIILIMPPIHISTHKAYQHVMLSTPNQSLEKIVALPIEAWKNHIDNSFEMPIFKSHPTIGHIKSSLYEAGALYASMSGSGSSVYGIFKDETQLPELEEYNQVFYDVGL